MFIETKRIYLKKDIFVHSPPQVGTPQSAGSQRPTSEQDSDCVAIQVLLFTHFINSYADLA